MFRAMSGGPPSCFIRTGSTRRGLPATACCEFSRAMCVESSQVSDKWRPSGPKGKRLEGIATVCGYFEKHGKRCVTTNTWRQTIYRHRHHRGSLAALGQGSDGAERHSLAADRCSSVAYREISPKGSTTAPAPACGHSPVDRIGGTSVAESSRRSRSVVTVSATETPVATTRRIEDGSPARRSYQRLRQRRFPRVSGDRHGNHDARRYRLRRHRSHDSGSHDPKNQEVYLPDARISDYGDNGSRSHDPRRCWPTVTATTIRAGSGHGDNATTIAVGIRHGPRSGQPRLWHVHPPDAHITAAMTVASTALAGVGHGITALAGVRHGGTASMTAPGLCHGEGHGNHGSGRWDRAALG